MAFEWIWLGLVAATSAIGSGAFAAFWLIHRPGLTLIDPESGPRTAFLIDRGAIVDATDAGRLVLEGIGPDHDIGADRLVRWLSDPFPDLPNAVARLAGGESRSLTARDGVGRLDLSRTGSRIRLELSDDESVRVGVDRVVQTALHSELEDLRGIGDGLSYPVWRQDGEGRIRWANRACLDLLQENQAGDTLSWPPRTIFDETPEPGSVTRLCARDRWFDCHTVALGKEVLISAIPADAVVASEKALDSFRQTISRTFAQLTVGLAIFDADRRLSVFNPALVGLTTLPGDLLAARPTLESFLDALRARRMMPEPRDYASWRDKVADVERRAEDGTYSELWHLPGGRSYRVTGRPQPDGSFALLMEDISAEIGLTRSFRSQLETTQAAFDGLEAAIVVFDGSGALTVSNAAYDALWEIDTASGLGHLDLSDAISVWSRRGGSMSLWRDIVNGAATTKAHDGYDVRLHDGRLLDVKRIPLSGGAVMMQFSLPHREGDALDSHTPRAVGAGGA